MNMYSLVRHNVGKRFAITDNERGGCCPVCCYRTLREVLPIRLYPPSALYDLRQLLGALCLAAIQDQTTIDPGPQQAGIRNLP